MNLKSVLLLIIVTSITGLPQTLSTETANNFISELLNNDDALENYVLPEELAISKRLGINYESVKHKFLISYEIPANISNLIRDEKTKYNLNIEKINNEFSVLNFEVSENSYKTRYYFKNNYLVSPPFFYYKDWLKIESEYFIFYVSETDYFNQYSIDRLESFVEKIFSLLNFTEEEKQIVKKEKLIYILCKDENEIEKLTDYKARGMGILAYDYVITTYNCHYHELLHILMNFKLRKLHLYTHPFFQEGFAVAFGGRGGYEPGIMMNLGKFLEQSDFLNAEQLFNESEYKNFDVSMSYPLSGLYNSFLINEIGIDEYLKLYIEYSSKNISGLVINQNKLPSEQKWKEFVNNYSNEEEIKIDFSAEDFQTLISDSAYILKANDEFYLLETKGNILITTQEKPENYVSKIFRETFPDKDYNGEKYFINVNESEVAVYNLFTNNSIANYVSGFSIDMKQVPKENGYYKFLINQAIFDEDTTEWIIKVQD